MNAPTFRSDWRERFPFWRERTHLYRNGFHAVPIVAVTDCWVYVPLDWLGDAKVTPDRVARGDCQALPRLKLEQEGRFRKRGAHYSIEPPADPEPVQSAPTTRKSVADLRRIMQREHPDKGGNVEAFIRAKREFDRLRG